MDVVTSVDEVAEYHCGVIALVPIKSALGSSFRRSILKSHHPNSKPEENISIRNGYNA